MSMLLILFLLVLAIVFSVLKCIKTSRVMLISTLVIFLIVGSGILPGLLLQPLESHYDVDSAPQYSHKRNAIVVLGTGTIKIPETDIVKPTIMAYSRIYQGLQLYQACKKNGYSCKIIISGGDALSVGTPEAVVYKNELLKFNVPGSDIETESQSMNTYKNAELTSQYLKKQNFERVFLVTSGIHMKRALLYFSHFGIETIPMISDYITAPLSFVPLGYNFAITDFILHEYVGILRYSIYNSLGWNTKASTAGYP